MMEMTDRYHALGIPYPDPDTCCPANCEGTGYVPVYMRKKKLPDGRMGLVTETEKDPELVRRWQEAEKNHPTDDGWHFVKCPECNGTGRNDGSSVWADEDRHTSTDQ